MAGEVAASYTFLHVFHRHNIELAWNLTHLDNAEPFGIDVDPNVEPPVLPETGLLSSLRIGWSYSDAERYTYDVTPSAGRRLGLSLSLADPAIGSQFRVVTASWSATQYLRAPWLRHHVFALRYAGGASFGDLDRRGVFAVGGFPQVDLLQALINQSLLGGSALRGYAPFSRTGTQFHLVQLEYRFPIFRFNQGLETLPVYLNRVYANIFADYGDAGNTFTLSQFRLGSGMELLLDFTLGYVVPFSMRIGYARGFMEGGQDQFYVNLGVPF